MAALVHHLLEASARSRPGHPAVSDRSRMVSYSQLDGRANQLAHVLVDTGVRVGDRVGVLTEKSVDAVAGLYGAMKAGAAYVPLDPHAPPPRLAAVVADAGIRCLLVSGEQARVAPAIVADASLPATAVIDLRADRVDTAPCSPLDIGVGTEDLAYILYTSGSTGVPKGVMISHANAMAFVEWARVAFGVTGDDRLSSHAPFHFDLSILDLYATAAAAATVVLVPPEASVFPVELRRFLAHERITVWYSVPSVLSQLAQRGGLVDRDLPDLRAVLFAGEVFPTKHLRRLMTALPRSRFANLYGPTETNVCAWYPVEEPPATDAPPVPIGGPAAGARLVVLGEDGETIRPGAPGELYVQGPSVARGYWNDPASTSSRFLTDPRPDLGGVWYRTGDLVQETCDGNLRYLGRQDDQIKSRGYRIELGDIEAAVYAHPAVTDCAVVAVPDELFTSRIHAFVVLDGEVAESELTQWCAGRLPPPMVPESFGARASLPRTATGKTDRRLLVESMLARAGSPRPMKAQRPD
jgi:amino acid adenylation domain-containing protein